MSLRPGVRLGQHEIIQVDASTGRVTSVRGFGPGTYIATSTECDLTPGRRTAVCGVANWTADAWLTENFDPRVPPVRR